MQANAPTTFIFGAGTVGQSLARALREAGVVVQGLYRREQQPAEEAGRFAGVPSFWGRVPAELTDADMVVLAVSDGAIVAAARTIAQRLHAGHVVVHCSGALPAALMRAAIPEGIAVGSMHPLQTFAAPEVASRLLGETAFGLEGDPEAVAASGALVRALGAWSFEVESAKKPLYHAAAVTASNHLIALADDAVALATTAGVPESRALEALLPLMRGTLRSLQLVGLPAALTGPVARGEAAVVRSHLAALRSATSKRLALYQQAALRVVDVARRRLDVDPDPLDAMELMLKKERT